MIQRIIKLISVNCTLHNLHSWLTFAYQSSCTSSSSCLPVEPIHGSTQSQRLLSSAGLMTAKKAKIKTVIFSPAYKLREKCSTTYRNRVLLNLNNNYLSNINHITHQSKPLQLQMRYVCLKKNVYLWKEKSIYVWKNFQLLFCKTTVNKATSLNTLKLHLFSNSFSSVTVFQLPKISHLKSLFQRFGPWMLLC